MIRCLAIILLLCSCAKVEIANSDNNWVDGLFYRDSNAIYFDPAKLDAPCFYVNSDYLTNQKKYTSIFPGGKIFFAQGEEWVSYYSYPVKPLANTIFESEKMLFYKITNEAVYLSADSNSWERLEFKLLKTNLSRAHDFRVYLKSSWFEGVYDVFSGKPDQ